MGSFTCRVVVAALFLGLVLCARGDELRLEDGEVLFGRVVKESGGVLTVDTAAGERTLRAQDVASRVRGEAPRDAVARREKTLGFVDAVGRADLAWFAWRHGLDATARRLATAAVKVSPDLRAARDLLGQRPGAGGWVAGWPAPWPHGTGLGPRWGAPRAAALARWGGTARSEQSVVAALDWLARHQRADGVVDADGFVDRCTGKRCTGPGGGHHGERVVCRYDGVTTATALMAWLAGGSTPVSGPHATNVKRAIAACVRLGADRSRHGGIFNQGFLAQALAEAYAQTRDAALRRPLAGLIAHLLSRQLPDGGWRYAGRAAASPTTGIVAPALGLAAQAGLPLDSRRVRGVLKFLDARVDARTGKSEYYHDARRLGGYTPTTANTASALTLRATLGRLAGAPHLAKQLDALAAKKPTTRIEFRDVKTRDGRTVKAQIGYLYPIAWYYTTVALHQHGDAKRWKLWFDQVRPLLIRAQHGKASCARGSWDPGGTYSASGGRAFITALGAMMLQTPYRYHRVDGR